MPTKKKHAYIFFNCNDEKGQESMNIRYNNEVYADTQVARKVLLEKVMEEVEKGRVNLADREAVAEAILKGDPTDASRMMQYGTIERVISH